MAGSKVGIIGTGGVGVACAWSILLQGLATRVTIYGRNADRARGEAQDFQHAAPLLPGCEIRGRGLDEIEAEDVLIITAGEHTKAGMTRLDILEANISVMDQVAGAIEAGALPQVAVVVTNPVDVLTEYLTRRWSDQPVSVLGSGTSLDTLRFSERLAQACGVHPRTVHAWVVGEHGDSSVFLYESATIGAMRLAEFAGQRSVDVGPEFRASVEHDVRTAAYTVRDLKGAATHGIGLAIGGLVRCLCREVDFVLPVSVRVADDVCASLPCALGPAGASAPLIPTMNDAERGEWEHSLSVLRAANDLLPIPPSS